jgi:hypothetical protein
VPAVQQRRRHRVDISDSEGSDAEVDGDGDAAALLPAAEGVERALRDMAATGWSETVAIESSEEEEEGKKDEEKEEEEEVEEEENMQGQEGDEHCVNEGADDGVAPAHAAVDARDGTAAEAPQPAQSQPGAVQASASQPFSTAPTSIVCDVTTTAIAGDVTAAAAAPAPAPAPQLASTSKTQARAPLRRASHFYVQRQLEDIDEAEANEEKEKVRGHASACNASCGALCVRGVTRD